MSTTVPVTGLSILAVAPAVASSLAVSTAVSAGFPPSFSLRGPRRVLDQRDIPCCVSCAFSAAAESAHASWDALAPLFHYFVTRVDVRGGSPSQLSNLTLEDANSAMEAIGMCLGTLHDVSMEPEGVAAAPSGAARTDALDRRLAPLSVFPPSSRIELLGDRNRVLEWKKSLLTGKPIVAGIDLPAGYGRTMTSASVDLGRLGPSHAVAVLGYRDSEQAFIVQDSRGPDWFVGGQWWMPYSFAESGFVYRAYSFNFR
jgi:hypothetical protein